MRKEARRAARLLATEVAAGAADPRGRPPAADLRTRVSTSQEEAREDFEAREEFDERPPVRGTFPPA